MIPKFPDFKKLELSDREDFEKFVSKFLPYSAFNFTYLWAWDLGGVSELNGNLVIRFATDFRTMEPFLSFLGTNECENTVHALLSFARSSGLSPELRFIPGEVIKYLKSASLKMEEDRDNFDYLFSPTKLAELQGNQFKELRRLARIFSEKYPEAVFQLEDLSDLSVQKKIFLTLRKWEYQKKIQNKTCDLNFEERALRRLLESAKSHQLILSCVFLHDEMIGFSIDEILPNGNAMAHFIKAVNSFRGIYEFLNRELAKYLRTLNVVLWNWQQDLNIKNLRETKLGYRPVDFIKMYAVSLNNADEYDLLKPHRKSYKDMPVCNK
jgi:hypothetical protein